MGTYVHPPFSRGVRSSLLSFMAMEANSTDLLFVHADTNPILAHLPPTFHQFVGMELDLKCPPPPPPKDQFKYKPPAGEGWFECLHVLKRGAGIGSCEVKGKDAGPKRHELNPPPPFVWFSVSDKNPHGQVAWGIRLNTKNNLGT